MIGDPPRRVVKRMLRATHTLTFNNGQVIQVNDPNSNIVIHFKGGGYTPV